MSSTSEAEVKAAVTELRQILERAIEILNGDASPVESRPADPNKTKDSRRLKNADV